MWRPGLNWLTQKSRPKIANDCWVVLCSSIRSAEAFEAVASTYPSWKPVLVFCQIPSYASVCCHVPCDKCFYSNSLRPVLRWPPQCRTSSRLLNLDKKTFWQTSSRHAVMFLCFCMCLFDKAAEFYAAGPPEHDKPASGGFRGVVGNQWQLEKDMLACSPSSLKLLQELERYSETILTEPQWLDLQDLDQSGSISLDEFVKAQAQSCTNEPVPVRECCTAAFSSAEFWVIVPSFAQKWCRE